jgi:hypothetical protein
MNAHNTKNCPKNGGSGSGAPEMETRACYKCGYVGGRQRPPEPRSSSHLHPKTPWLLYARVAPGGEGSGSLID